MQKEHLIAIIELQNFYCFEQVSISVHLQSNKSLRTKSNPQKEIMLKR